MALFLCVVMAVSVITIDNTQDVNAAVKIMFGKKLSITVGKTDVIVVKGKAKAKSSSKKVAKVSKVKKGKTSIITVKGMKTGKAKITVQVGKSKKKVAVSVLPKKVKTASATLTSMSQVKVTWGKAKGATKYEVYRAENGGSKKKLATVSSLTYTDSNIIQGTYLYYYIKAVGNKSTKAGYSSPAIVKTWKLDWSDEFNGTSLDTNKWNNNGASGRTGYGNGELQDYQLKYCEVKDGSLVIKPRFQYNKSSKSVVKDSCYSTKLWTKGQYTTTYGKVEMRVKMPKGQGTWAAGWMLGVSGGWPACGEIDIFETTPEATKTIIPQSIHCQKFNGLPNYTGNKHTDTTIKDATSAFHTYGIEWFNDRVDFTIDGRKTWSYDARVYSSLDDYTKDEKAWPFKQPFYLILNCAIGGTLGGAVTPSYWKAINTVGNIVTYEDYMYIDSVRVYK